MGYSVDIDTVPDDGMPYYADLCPTCHEVRPFRMDEDDDGFGYGECALCGLVVETHFMDSPGTSPEPEGEPDDAVTDDAMTVTYAADDAGGYEWDETYYCTHCGRDRLLGMELREGRVIGTCEFCQQREDFTPPEDDEGPIVLWCSACQGWRWCSWLCPGAAENDGDEDWARVCESCASWCFEDDGPEVYVQRAQCGECKVGTLVTQPPDERVPATVGTVWSCDTCRHVRLVPVMTPKVAAKALLWGMGEGPPRQWHLPVVAA